MKEKFLQDYPKFQLKIANFVLTQNFTVRCEEYENLFNQMASVSPDDMKEYIQKSPQFLEARNKSLSSMERIVAIHKELQTLFELSQEQLGARFEYNLEQVDAYIADKLKESGYLLTLYTQASEAGRKAIETLNNPFLAQAL